MPGNPTYLRYRQIRRTDNLDDQQTPTAIEGANAASTTQEDYQVYALSQVKRVIFGSKPGNWYKNFAGDGILDLAELTRRAGARRYGVALVGVRDGSNRTFTLPDKFLIDPQSGITIEVFHNGRRLQGGMMSDPRVADFYPIESGGPGTGYDTIFLLTFGPSIKSNLIADYTVP